MRPKSQFIALLGAALVTAAVAAPAMAKDGDITREGGCSASSDWKLKAGPRDGGIEVEFEVDQNQNGQQWRVRLTDNGDAFFQGVRTTQAPSGSFEIERTTRNQAGSDRIVGRAVNLVSGEMCRGAITL